MQKLLVNTYHQTLKSKSALIFLMKKIASPANQLTALDWVPRRRDGIIGVVRLSTR